MSSLLSLQGAAGNRAVSTAVAARRRLQRAWNTDKTHELKPSGAGVWDAPISEDDAKAIIDAVGEVERAAPSSSSGKLLVYYGVGTGNPAGAWGNPTVSASVAEMAERQMEPGFLADAATKGYFVAALNFNAFGGKPVEVTRSDEQGIYLKVSAHFPLVVEASPHGKTAFEALKGLAAKAGSRFALMNSINQFDYAGLIAMIPKLGSYLRSYAEQPGEEAAFARASPKHWFENPAPDRFAVLSDVFVQPEP